LSTIFLACAVAFACTVSASTAAQIAVMGISTDDDTDAMIQIDGAIVAGDDEKFKALALKYEKADVVLSSQGGSVLTAIEIGTVIRLKHFSTSVWGDGVCASACALIWLGGEARGIVGAGRVGLHATYREVDGKKIESGAANAVGGAYLSQMGLLPSAILKLTSAGPDK
jgi:hypothetical protein